MSHVLRKRSAKLASAVVSAAAMAFDAHAIAYVRGDDESLSAAVKLELAALNAMVDFSFFLNMNARDSDPAFLTALERHALEASDTVGPDPAQPIRYGSEVRRTAAREAYHRAYTVARRAAGSSMTPALEGEVAEAGYRARYDAALEGTEQHSPTERDQNALLHGAWKVRRTAALHAAREADESYQLREAAYKQAYLTLQGRGDAEFAATIGLHDRSVSAVDRIERLDALRHALVEAAREYQLAVSSLG